MDFAEPQARITTAEDPVELRVDGPQTLLQAVPYLLGFHPQDSLVLVGAGGGAVRVTARLDLRDLVRAGPLEHAVDVLVRARADTVIAVIYESVSGEDPAPAPASVAELVAEVGAAVRAAGCALVDIYLVRRGRWWSHGRDGVHWGTGGGRPVADPPTPFAVAATVAGLTALPRRHDLVAVLNPIDRCERERLLPLIAAEQVATASGGQGGSSRSLERTGTRAVFAAARRADAGYPAPGNAVLARLGAALSVTAVRDSVWLAVDDARLDGAALWIELARRLPAPYDVPALFLYGWNRWRRGDGVSAQVAVSRALDGDPDYTAAQLLQAALAHGLDPRRIPRLRRGTRGRQRPLSRDSAADGAPR